jgi:hypothetical protein
MGVESSALCNITTRPTSVDMTQPLLALPAPIPIWQGVWVEYA